MLKVIVKKGKEWKDSNIQVGESTDIKRELYNSSREYIDFFPSFVFILEKKQDLVFIESIINVLRGFSTEDLEEEEFQKKLYESVKKNYSDLSFEQFLNAILYVITQDTEDLDDIIQEIKASDILKAQEEVEQDLEKPEVRLLRCKSSFGKIFDKPSLQEIYDKIQLNPQFILAKTLYGNEQEYLKESLTENQQKAVDVFIFSEHSSEKVQKVLVKGVINLLYYKSLVNINIRISDTGFISLKIEPKKLFVDSDLSDIKTQVNRVYYMLTEKNDIQVDLTSFETKITYPKRLGYFTKELVASIENSEVKNNKVEYDLSGRKCWFSSKEEKFNFTIKDLETIKEVENIAEKVNQRVEYYLENLGKFTKYRIDDSDKIIIKTRVPHGLKTGSRKIKIFNTNFDGVYDLEYRENFLIFKPNKNTGLSQQGNFTFIGNVKKTSLVELRKSGLVIDSKECQKERRPELLLENDPSIGDDIMELNGRKFRCNSPYIYHGVINKVNCCYKKKQENKQEIVKKKPLKLFTKVKKNSTKILEGTLVDYLSNSYVLYSVSDLNEERTINACLDYIFGQDIENLISNIDPDIFLKNFKDIDLETWKNLPEKSITDVIKVLSLHTNTTILILLDNLINGLSIECQDTPYFENYVVIYRSNEKIQSYYPITNGDTKIHTEKDIKELVEVSKNVCKSGFYQSIFNYRNILVSQITDYQNLVIFIEINSGGYIPVSPSTPINSTDVFSINSNQFKLLYPESQYKSLLSQVKNYPELEPIGITKILNSNVVTGIKLKNGGIVPVTHSEWQFSPLQTVEDLFYIEKYYEDGEDFSNNDEVFLQNIEKVKGIEEIKVYIENGDYTKLIEVITPITDDLDEITRLIWFLINN